LLEEGLLADPRRSPRVLVVGGEPMDEAVRRRVIAHPTTRAIQCYGPTECTIECVVGPIDARTRGSVIGRPIANTRVYVFDRQRRLMPTGAYGEMYVAGAGVARGYLGASTSSADAFVADPFVHGERMYRTGDRGRWLSNGTIEISGRFDDQVKVRGFRVDLGDVEATLLRHPQVKRAAVVVRGSGPQARLVGFFTSTNGGQAESVRMFLRNALPEFMVPAVLTRVEDIPLSPSGKVDRRALPTVTESEIKESELPRDSTERNLVRIWQAALGIESPIGIHDDFFDLGGHSLLAVRVLSDVEALFGVELPLVTFFDNATIAQLANALREAPSAAPTGSLAVINAGGARRPLFCVHPFAGGVLRFRRLARYLDPDQPVYGLLPQQVGRRFLHSRIEGMARYGVEVIRQTQPEGPYLLCGHSLGGLVAYEMARRLVEEGQVVSLCLIDPDRPRLSWREIGWDPDHPGEELPRRSTASLATWARVLGRSSAWWGYQAIRGGDRVSAATWLRDVERAARRAGSRYVARPYRGAIALLQTSKRDEVLADELSAWRSLTPGAVTARLIPGGHLTLFDDPNVEIVASTISTFLAETSDVV
jgi:thioesterase domain-containing protein/acyl carrier protein